MSQQSSIDARRQWWPDMTYALSRIELTATRMGCKSAESRRQIRSAASRGSRYLLKSGSETLMLNELLGFSPSRSWKPILPSSVTIHTSRAPAFRWA